MEVLFSSLLLWPPLILALSLLSFSICWDQSWNGTTPKSTLNLRKRSTLWTFGPPPRNTIPIWLSLSHFWKPFKKLIHKTGKRSTTTLINGGRGPLHTTKIELQKWWTNPQSTLLLEKQKGQLIWVIYSFCLFAKLFFHFFHNDKKSLGGATWMIALYSTFFR